MAVHVRSAAYGRAALDALTAAVADAKHSDPMAAVTVVAPNNIAGIVARRHLAAGTGERRGVAGVEITTLGRLAERLALGALAPRRPLTRTVLAAAWRAALAERPGSFAAVADHRATVRALVDRYAELRDLDADARAAVAASTPLAGEVVELAARVHASLAADWYDAIDLLAAATQAPHLPATTVLYLPQRLNRSEQRFAAALACRAELVVVAGLTGAQRADAAIRHTLDAIGAAVPDEPPAVATATDVLNASDSDDEVRCVVRDVVQTLQTTPAHRVAVLYSARLPYARLLHEQLGAAGITVNGAGSRAVDERALARAVLEILALAEADVPRAGLFGALSGAPLRDFTGARIPVSRWERMSRAAWVVAGDDWTNRLDAVVRTERARSEAEQRSDDPQRWVVERATADIDTATALQSFAVRLRDELRRAAAMTTWAELATWCRQLVETLVGDLGELRAVPPDEQYAVAPLLGILDGLQALAGIESTASLELLIDVLDVELAGTLPRVGRFGDGVFVGPFSAAVGLDVDTVFLVGLSEDLYPGRLASDALLPDVAREASSGQLPSLRDQLHAQYRHVLAGLSVARERTVACFPRGDLRRSTRRLPSRWLLPTLRELCGDKELAATEWHTADYRGAMHTSGSFAGELLTTTSFSTEQEWRTRATAATRQPGDDVVAAAVTMIDDRASDSFTRFDGNLAGVPGLPDFAVDDQPVSPTALEGYAECPHSFFVQRLLRVVPVEQPEQIVSISPMDIGNLVHESLDELVHACADDLPGYGQPWTPDQRARLMAIAVAKADDFRLRGLTGHPRLWERERERILADVVQLLDADDEWRAETKARVVASEMPFGLHGTPAVQIPVPGGRVIMRGSADKIDEGADGTLYVTDIKTGSRRRFKDITPDTPFVGGTKLQLPVYAHAARARYGEATTPVHAGYWFVRRDPGRIGLDLSPDLERAYSETLGVLVRSIAAGLFPLRAPATPDYAFVQCPYCNPDGIGHGDNRERWERKRTDPALRELVAVIEPEALADPEAAP